MSFIPKRITLPQMGQDKFQEILLEELLRYSVKLSDTINGGLKMTENLDVAVKSATTGVADTEVAVAHGLKRTPVGYIVSRKDKAAIIYDGSTSWDSTNIYIKADQATVTVKLIIF